MDVVSIEPIESRFDSIRGIVGLSVYEIDLFRLKVHRSVVKYCGFRPRRKLSPRNDIEIRPGLFAVVHTGFNDAWY